MHPYSKILDDLIAQCTNHFVHNADIDADLCGEA